MKGSIKSLQQPWYVEVKAPQDDGTLKTYAIIRTFNKLSYQLSTALILLVRLKFVLCKWAHGKEFQNKRGKANHLEAAVQTSFNSIALSNFFPTIRMNVPRMPNGHELCERLGKANRSAGPFLGTCKRTCIIVKLPCPGCSLVFYQGSGCLLVQVGWAKDD